MYLISACLCGVNCKYNGKNNINHKCLKLFKEGNAILVCPEQLGGMATPRIPSEILGNSKDIIDGNGGVVLNKLDQDVTDNFLKGAQETLRIAREAGILMAILKDGSPSCGSNFIYDGTFTGKKRNGQGITTSLLKSQGIDVISEKDYSNRINLKETIIPLSRYKDKVFDKGIDLSMLYKSFKDDDEKIINLPEALEDYMKELTVILAKKFLDTFNINEISEVTGLQAEEVKKILDKKNKKD